MTIERDDLEKLAIDLANAKSEEKAAHDARVMAEQRLADAIGGDSQRVSAKCGRITVKVSRGWNYKVDDINGFKNEFPELCKTKTVLDETAYEHLRNESPEIFLEASAHVTVTPKKVAVELKL